jgi:murein DD-endopeptidase MepM/ murein hydrolase activator NlpD
MSELEDVSVAGLYSTDEIVDGASVELPSVMVEAASLKSGIERLAKIADARIDELAKTPSIWPVDAEPGERWISSSFGWRKSPFTGAREMHAGLDISARRGTPIIATADGTIVKMKRDRFLGKFVEIRHNEKFSTMYGHLDNFAKGMKSGTKIKRGEVIGCMGNTGRTTGCHLHYEVRVHGKRVNPIEYILD